MCLVKFLFIKFSLKVVKVLSNFAGADTDQDQIQNS